MEGVVKPLRLDLNTYPVTPVEDMRKNVALNSPGATFVQFKEPHDIPLAIVGGGPSVRDHLDELKAWPGHIWGVNASCTWLSTQGIKSIFFTVDPADRKLNPAFDYFIARAETALLSTSCDPEMFKRIPHAFAFHTHGEEASGPYVTGGSTSVSRAQILSVLLGFRDVSFFGCEGSWDFGSRTHTTKDDAEDALVIRAGGKDYVTNLQFMLQCQELSAVIKGCPGIYHDRSGGLLGAMLEHPDTWEIVAFSGPLRDRLDPQATELYRKAA